MQKITGAMHIRLGPARWQRLKHSLQMRWSRPRLKSAQPCSDDRALMTQHSFVRPKSFSPTIQGSSKNLRSLQQSVSITTKAIELGSGLVRTQLSKNSDAAAWVLFTLPSEPMGNLRSKS